MLIFFLQSVHYSLLDRHYHFVRMTIVAKIASKKIIRLRERGEDIAGVYVGGGRSFFIAR